MCYPIRRIPLWILLLASFIWLLAAPADSRIERLNGVEGLVFPRPGPVPPNVRFLIALERPRGRDLPADPSPSSLLLDPRAVQLHLTDGTGHRIPLEMQEGPHGLVKAVPESPLVPGRRYSVKVEGQGNALDALRAAVENRYYAAVDESDERAPRWSGPPKIEAARRASDDCFYLLDCDDEREIDFSLPVEDGGSPMMLLWSDAPVDGSKPTRLQYQVLRGPRASLCCFEPNDRLVRFEVVDAAGNRSKPDPPMLAFGD